MTTKIEVPIKGMDCAECAQHVQHAIAGVPGVESVNVLLATEKAVVALDPVRADLSAIRRAVEGAGYSVPLSGGGRAIGAPRDDLARPIL